MRSTQTLVVVVLLCCVFNQIPAQTNSRSNGTRMRAAAAEPNGGKPAVSEMRNAIEIYTVDRSSLNRSYPVAISPARRERFRKFYSEWLASLEKLDFDSMSQDGKIDYILF